MPNHHWRALAEPLIKATRWDEWLRHDYGWQGQRITELADALRRFLPSSEVAVDLAARPVLSREVLMAAILSARDSSGNLVEYLSSTTAEYVADAILAGGERR